MPDDALIGATGFVGGVLAAQHPFAARFNSSTIDSAAGQAFGTVVCAAAPGSMFEANRFPDRDAARMDALMAQIDRIGAARFVLISSIAVLADFAAGDDEDTTGFQTGLAYGRNRRRLEVFCAERFKDCLIVRLPALYGPGLRKNFIFDLLNPVPSMLTPAKFDALRGDLPADLAALLLRIYRWKDEVQMQALDRTALASSGARAALEAALTARGATAVQFTNPGSTFQYYGLARLWDDIGAARAAGLDVVHLATEPLRADAIHARLMGVPMPATGARPHAEDMRTRAAPALRGHDGPYLAGAGAVLDDLARFFDAARGNAI